MERDPWFENAKFVLINLVVIGHFLEIFAPENGFAQQVWQAIYAFHMPAFIFVAGYFARPHDSTHLNASVRKLVVLLVIFSILYEGCHIVFQGQISWYTRSLSPFWMLWFLLCLIVWNFFLPYVLALPKPLVITTVASLLFGLLDWNGNTLSSSRIVVFFPFFVLGFIFSDRKLFQSAVFSHPMSRISAVVFFMAVPFLLNAIEINSRILWGSNSFDRAGLEWHQGFIMRAEALVIATLATVCFMILVPRTKSVFTSRGRNSIAVYLLHAVFPASFIYFDGELRILLGELETTLACIIAGLLVTLLLSSTFVRRIFDTCIAYAEHFLSHATPKKAV